MKRVAIINQRYGREVNGGSEYYTMQLAEHMQGQYEVEILTTQALSYMTWENYYPKGEEVINGIKVRRFRVRYGRRKLLMKVTGKLITLLGMNWKWLNRIWIKAQGPYTPELIHFIEEHENEYDAFIFVTYLYYPTVFGMEKVRDKAVFVPTAHEEAYIHYKLMQDVFAAPAAYVFLTEEEKELVQSLFPIAHIPCEVAAMGIEPEKTGGGRAAGQSRDAAEETGVSSPAVDFCEKYGIDKPYIIYAGRIDIDKGCGQMMEYFRRYCKENEEYLLVLIGKSAMGIPEDEHIRYLGFLSEEDKNSGIAGARALCLPSSHESLSIAVLEAMYLGTPVIVNGDSEVLAGHCRRSSGGISYKNYEEFRKAMQSVKDDNIHKEMAANAVRYVEDNYQWDSVLERWNRIITGIIERIGRKA